MRTWLFPKILTAPMLLMSCASTDELRQDHLLLRPSLTNAKIRFQTSLKKEEAARDTALGLRVPESTQLEPNTDSKPALSIGYHGYSVSVSQSQPLSDEAVQEKGDTRSSDYQFHGAKGWLGFDVYYQEYQGMHDIQRLAQPQGTDSAPSHLYAYYPDLKVSRKGLNLFYINDSENYKHNAHMYQTEYQPDSADSLLFLISIDHLKLWNLPLAIQDTYREKLPSDQMEANAISIMLGYAFILKSSYGPWFASNVFVGRSYQFQGPIDQILEGAVAPTAADKAIVSTSLGLDRKSWFFGLSFWVDSITMPMGRMESVINTSSYEMFLGCRL